MDTLKYIIKRILLAILILFGVSIIIFALSRMMPTDYVDSQYATQVSMGKMKQEDVDRIKKIYGLYSPEAYLSVKFDESHEYSGKKFTKDVKTATYERVEDGVVPLAEFYAGSYDYKIYRITLNTKTESIGGVNTQVPTTYELFEVHENGWRTEGTEDGADSDDEDDNKVIMLNEQKKPLEEGIWTVSEETENGVITRGVKLTATKVYEYEGDKATEVEVNKEYGLSVKYRVASFGDKLGNILANYFTWLGNVLKGDLGVSFKYKQDVGKVIVDNMGISFGIAFVATILQFLIAIPLGIKAATHQYGVVDYTVTVLTMIGISLPTFFLAAIMIRIFSVGLGIFPVNGLSSPHLVGASGIAAFGDMLWHLVLPMFVLVILSVGSLMRYTRTNTLEVLNADYIRTARAKGLSERSVVYKHAFRNTMIPIVTLMAGILPSLFSGAMITETVFAIPGIGLKAYDALLVADVPFIMGYNMFLAILTVLGTLLSDIMYAVVDPRVKLK